MDAVPALIVGALRRRRQRRRLQGPIQPRRRDLRGRALPARRGRERGPRGGGVRLQPLAGVRGIGAAAREAARRDAERTAGGHNRPDGGALPGARALALLRRLPARAHERSNRAAQRARECHLLAAPRPGDRGAGREDRAHRPLAHAGAPDLAARRLRKHVHIFRARQHRQAVPRAEAACCRLGARTHARGAPHAVPRTAPERAGQRGHARHVRASSRRARAGRRRGRGALAGDRHGSRLEPLAAVTAAWRAASALR